MSIFNPVILKFKDKEYTLPANKIMRVLAQIESKRDEFGEPCGLVVNDLTLQPLPIIKISEAYGTALRFVGADVEDDEVYEQFFIKDAAEEMQKIIYSLMLMMVPPKRLLPSGDTEVESGNEKKP